MPITAASNGVRPEIRALGVLKLGVTVTPAEINAFVGTGEYAAKYVSFLRTRYGFTIDVVKNGREVVGYTVLAEPTNAEELRATQPKVKVVKAPKAKATVAVPLAETKVKTAVTKRKVDPVERQFGTTGEIASSFSVDPDWDNADFGEVDRKMLFG